jgi:hypothetical protein
MTAISDLHSMDIGGRGHADDKSQRTPIWRAAESSLPAVT